MHLEELNLLFLKIDLQTQNIGTMRMQMVMMKNYPICQLAMVDSENPLHV
ncbi:hypothetical protein [Chryseobacterium sp. IT-36CA2]